MNCQDFETIIIEIARDRLMDAVARERGLEHVQGCASCATLLVEERALSRDLRALSARDGAGEIPARIENALLSAFRQQAAAPIAAPAGATRRRRLLLAAAALALLSFGFSLAGWIASSPKQESTARGTADGRTATTGVPAATPDAIDQRPPQPVKVRRPYPLIAGPTTGKRQKRSPLASANRRSSSDNAPREFVTQFFPVMQGGELIPLESGQIVRVKMPRSNLIPLGIPFNQERANETIRADVLVSNDGLARAIRFVY